MIIQFFKHLRNKIRWMQFKKRNQVNGLLASDLATVRSTIAFISTIDFRHISRLECREVSAMMPIRSLYDLLYFLRECNIAIDEKGFLSNRFPPEGQNITLSTWLLMPANSGWDIKDINEAVIEIGKYIECIYQNRGDSPESYLERRLSKVLDCYMTLVEVLGDKTFMKRRS